MSKRLKKDKRKQLYKGGRIIASIILLVFMFIEEIILKPLRKIKVVVLERTIKRLNGHWTIGILIFLKTIEGLCKIVLPLAPNPWVALGIVVLDGVLGFISMNIIIHGHENLKQFEWYPKFVAWLAKLKEESQGTKFYKRTKAQFLELKATAKSWAKDAWRYVFGEANPRGIVRYVRMAIRMRLKKRRNN